MPNSMSLAVSANFATLDWLVVLIYFAVVIGVGFWSSRSQKSKRDYFLGGRRLPWWVVGLSIIATETSALTFIGIPAIAFGALSISDDGTFSVSGGNMHFINLVIGYIIGRIIIAWKIVPYYFNGDVYTPFQLLKRAFGHQTRYAAAGLSLVGMSLGAGVRVTVTAIPVTIVMRTVWPEFPMWLAVVVIMVAALIYTSLGGIKAVVWTDMIQYFIFIGGGLFTVFYIPSLLTGDLAAPSGAEGWAAIREVAPGHLQTFNLGLLSPEQVAAAGGGGLSFGQYLWVQIKEIFAGDFNLIMGIFPQTIGIILAFGFDQLNVQRVLGCRNIKEGRAAMLMSAFLIFPQFLLFLMIGVCLFAFYKLNGFEFGIMPWDPASVSAETGMGNPKGDYVFPVFMVTHVPVIFRGLLVAGILAAAMSSVSSALSAMSSISIMDFYRPLKGVKGEGKSELGISVAATVMSGIALMIIALLCIPAELLLNLAFKLVGLTGGGILGAFVFAMITKRGYPGPAIAGLITSFIFMIIYNVFRSYTAFSINWPWDTTVGMVVCLLVAWLASFGLPIPEGRDISSTAEDDV